MNKPESEKAHAEGQPAGIGSRSVEKAKTLLDNATKYLGDVLQLEEVFAAETPVEVWTAMQLAVESVAEARRQLAAFTTGDSDEHG